MVRHDSLLLLLSYLGEERPDEDAKLPPHMRAELSGLHAAGSKGRRGNKAENRVIRLARRTESSFVMQKMQSISLAEVGRGQSHGLWLMLAS